MEARKRLDHIGGLIKLLQAQAHTGARQEHPFEVDGFTLQEAEQALGSLKGRIEAVLKEHAAAIDEAGLELHTRSIDLAAQFNGMIALIVDGRVHFKEQGQTVIQSSLKPIEVLALINSEI